MMNEMIKLHVCPLCKCTHAKEFHHTDSFGIRIMYYQCAACGFIFQDPNESQAADPEFYEQTYRKIYQDNESPTPKDLDIQRQRAEHTNSWLKANGIKYVKNVLDIGASAGVLLNQFRTNYGCSVSGVEPGKMYREFASTSGVKMVASLEELKASSPDRFDLVSLMHVLEHIPDPITGLRDIREGLMTSDGHLLIEVPNFYAHDSYELAHLACYTRHSLRQLLAEAGFKVIAMRTHGFPRSRLLKLYLTAFAKPASPDEVTLKVKPERFVALKRRLGMIYRRILQKFFPHLTWLPVKKD
jgi:2-polyprenyl-3-methyl-5-hydroxy-6-metoxy-1,4-benzoquinol methylase